MHTSAVKALLGKIREGFQLVEMKHAFLDSVVCPAVSPIQRWLFFLCSWGWVGGQALGYTAKAGQQVVTLLPLPHSCFDSRHVPPQWAQDSYLKILFTSQTLSFVAQGTVCSAPLPGQLRVLTLCLRGTVSTPGTTSQYLDP